MKTLKLNTVIILTICVASLAKAASMPAGNHPVNHPGNSSPFVLKFTALPTTSAWSLCYESDQIYIYERWITVSADHSYRERKGEMYVNCSLEEALTTINDYENVNKWNENVKESKLLKKSSANNWVTYTLFDLPWPFQNRDVVSEYTVEQVSPGRQVQVKISSVDNMMKLKDGISRITKYTASWTVKRITESKCWICFSAACDNPPAAPRAIQDPIVRKSFHKNLLNLRKVLE